MWPWSGSRSSRGVGDDAAASAATAGAGAKAAATGTFEVGALVLLAASATGLGFPLSGTVSAAGAKEATVAVEVFAPAQGDDAMNPHLARRILPSVPASQLRRRSGSIAAATTADAAGVLVGSVGRPGASMCSVPLALPHRLGLGANAEGRSARLGGLAKGRQDLEGMTCTVLWGPSEEGRYTVELSLDESEQSVVAVYPECLTLRLRRAALQELLAPVDPRRALRAKRAGATGAGAVEPVDPDEAHSIQPQPQQQKRRTEQSNGGDALSKAELQADARRRFRETPPPPTPELSTPARPKPSAVAAGRRLGRQAESSGGPSLVERAALAAASGGVAAEADTGKTTSATSSGASAPLAASAPARAQAKALSATEAMHDEARDRKFAALDAELANCCCTDGADFGFDTETSASAFSALPAPPSSSASRLPAASASSPGSSAAARGAKPRRSAQKRREKGGGGYGVDAGGKA